MAARRVSTGVAARMLGMPVAAVRAACERGEIDAVRIGSGHWYVLLDEVKRLQREADERRAAIRPVRRVRSGAT